MTAEIEASGRQIGLSEGLGLEAGAVGAPGTFMRERYEALQ